MPSRLNGLQRSLTWSDFGAPRPGPPPAPGVRATAAQTRARPRRSVNAESVPGVRPHRFRLRDDVMVSVELDAGNSFVNRWTLDRPDPFPTDVLHHEQGHYDLVALFCRDMFLETVALKAQTFATPNEVLAATQAINQRFDRLIAAVHAVYDTQTTHGTNAAQQQRWDGFIQAAFTTPRNPPAQAVDGTPLKTPLADVLTGAGIVI